APRRRDRRHAARPAAPPTASARERLVGRRRRAVACESWHPSQRIEARANDGFTEPFQCAEASATAARLLRSAERVPQPLRSPGLTSYTRQPPSGVQASSVQSVNPDRDRQSLTDEIQPP